MVKIAMIVVLAMLVGWAGCEKKQDKEAAQKAVEQEMKRVREMQPAAVKEESVTADDVKKEVGEAAETTGEYLGQKKDEFIEDATARLQILELQIGSLSEEAQEKGAAAVAKYTALKTGLAAKMEAAKGQMAKLAESSGSAWQASQEGMSAALTELQKAYDKAKSELTGASES